MKLLETICLTLAICCSIGKSEGFSKNDGGIFSEIWNLFADISEPLHTWAFNDDKPLDTDSDNAFTEKEIGDFRDFLKFGHDIKGTPIGDILENGHFPSDFGLGDDVTMMSVIRDLETNLELRQFVKEKFFQGFADVIQSYVMDDAQDNEESDKPEFMVEDPADDVEEDGQVGGWEGCRRDYNALALPFTNGLIDRVARNIIYENLPVENRTCEEVCDILCAIVLSPAVCLVACTPRYVCRDEGTIDTTVDLVVRYYFPPMNMSRWNWAMVDAMGKIPPALTFGQLHWSGSYQKCPEISVSYTYEEFVNTTYNISEPRHFTGQYYRLAFQPLPFQNRTFNLLFDTCVPSTCSEDDVARYVTEDNVLFRILFGESVLNWKLNKPETWSGVYEILDEDIPPVTIFLIITISIVILNVLSMVYETNFRKSIMAKKLQAMKLSRSSSSAHQLSRSVSYNSSPGAFDNPVYSIDKESSVNNDKASPGPDSGKVQFDLGSSSVPDAYQHVHPEDYRRFSISSDISDNFNNNNRTADRPELARSVSTQSTASTKPLFPEDMSTMQSLAEQPPTISERLEVLFVGFSPYSNIIRLMRTDRPDGYIPTIDSVRFLSLCWAYLGYTWLLGPVVAETWVSGNVVWALRTYPKKFFFQPILNFHFATDSYLLISGILVTYHWLKRYDADAKNPEKMTWKSVVFLYLHRYWRVLPGLAMTLLLFTSTYKWLSGGPFASKGVGDAANCKVNWWTDILMLHNLVNTDVMCLAWLFMVPLIFQLIIMASLILVPLVWKPILGYILLAAFYVIHIGATAGVSADLASKPFAAGPWLAEYFITPWCRAGPFLIGMAVGIYMYKNKCKLNLPKLAIPVGWLMSLVLITTVQYSTYGQFKEGGTRWSDADQVAYNTLARSAWAVGVAWIIVASTAGRGGFVGQVLNWRAFQPLSRMNYSVILFYSMLIFSHAYSVQSPLIITTKRITHMFLSNLVMGHLIAVFFTVIVYHYPLSLGIERAITVKTKLDCITAGKHPEIPANLQRRQDSVGDDSAPSVYEPSRMKNALFRLDSIEEEQGGGYQQLSFEKQPKNMNRQNSITSL